MRVDPRASWERRRALTVRFRTRHAPVYIQLTTREYGKALDFYREVFGWETDAVSDTDEFRYSTASFDDEALLGVLDGTTDLPEGVPSNWFFFQGATTSTRRCSWSSTTAAA